MTGSYGVPSGFTVTTPEAAHPPWASLMMTTPLRSPASAKAPYSCSGTLSPTNMTRGWRAAPDA
jgi:hypothetical protein